MKSIWGIMQGRFTNKGGFFPQQFPWGNWEGEFEIASACNIDCIEWMFNADRYEENPLWTPQGREKIKNTIRNTGVSVLSVCANFFMESSIENIETKEIIIKYPADYYSAIWRKRYFRY